MDVAKILNQFLEDQKERLAVYRTYRRTIDSPYVKSALSFVIEDTQESIARIASRLRQLDHPPSPQIFDAPRQPYPRQRLDKQLRFVRASLQAQLEWYNTQTKKLLADADTQATLVALAEQTRMRLERWDNLMDEMKVSVDE